MSAVADQPATQVGLVRERIGVGLMNALTAAATDTRDVVVRRLDDTALSREVRLYWRSRAQSPAAVSMFRRFVIDAPVPQGTVRVTTQSGT